MQLNFRKYGEKGPVIIILHGFLGSLDNWHTLATQWGNNGFVVYSLDHRNHGKSPHAEAHSLQLMADDVYSFMKEQGIEKAGLLGHSMGGKVAMIFTIQHPELVTKLLVADISTKTYRADGHDDVFKAIFAVDTANLQSRKEAEQQMEPFLPDFATRQFILKSLDRTENGFKWKFNIDILHKQYDEVVKGIINNEPINVETLIVRGGNSGYVKDKDMDEIKTIFPMANLVTIANAGHWLHADQPIEFSSCVTNFFNNHENRH